MPENENDKTVELDTSGPGANVELPEVTNEEDKTFENEVKKNEANITYDDQPDNTSAKSDEQPAVRDEKNEGGEVTQKADEEKSDKPQDNTQAVEEYSEGVKKRIAKLTKKMREAERQKEAALEYAKGIKAEADKTKSKLSTMEPGYMIAMEGRVKSGLQAASAKLTAAREAGDIPAEVEAQKDIARLGLEEARVEMMKKRVATESKQKPVEQPTLDQAIAPRATANDPKAEAWAEKNEWFGKDNAMTYTAFDLHKILTEEEGMDASTDEYYEEIDKRMRIDFPHKFDKQEVKVTTKPTQQVASVKRSVNPGRKTVRLTPSQVTIAKKLGVPLEEYAKQLNITEGV